MSTSSPAENIVEIKIGDLAERTRVSTRSLRYYETKHLISSNRTSGGQRLYSPDAIERVELIQQLFRAGLSSDDIVALLPCVYSGTTTPAMIQLLIEQKTRITDQINELTATRDRLNDVLSTARQRLVAA